MQNSITAFILIVITVILGLVLFGLSSSYLSIQAANANVENFAQNVANGFRIQQSIASYYDGNVTRVITLTNFNYNGSVYISVFYVPTYLYGNSLITPQFAKGYALVNNSVGTIYNNINIYSLSLKDIYSGSITVWTTSSNSVFTVSFPKQYDALVLIFVKDGNMNIEVGYTWLKN
ncbi:hypothetical protein DFR86_00455 [Acidianus sulfidivorans JP7]|uniref:Uncharacterized protein n=1 Tax=Acidianus sulfidivorans JP7 TaxID=619593 RepID=A0A2U9IJK4_9CREN|nr:hypothetical protein [Acidianus sulfidivorans]AWR96165.1 hypothetical protein DFR86_00455 [Acidianus sulfidivorans JP7]